MSDSVLPYEEAVKVWASRKFNLDHNSIEKVDFDISVDSGCPTCGPDVDAEVTVFFTSDKPSFYAFDRYDLGGLIREVLEAASSEPRP